MFTEKGVVYVDSDNEAEDLDTLDSTCRGHGISVFSDPQNTTFQIVSTRIHNEGKHVVRGVVKLYAISKKYNHQLNSSRRDDEW